MAEVTVDSIFFQEFFPRRTGILCALTTELDRFLEQCKGFSESNDPVSLLGLPDGKWEVIMPPLTMELPAPTNGINMFTDRMGRRDWLHLVAANSDAWLISVAFFQATKNRLNRSDRNKLLRMINAVATIVEIVGKGEQDEDAKQVDDGVDQVDGQDVKQDEDGQADVDVDDEQADVDVDDEQADVGQDKEEGVVVEQDKEEGVVVEQDDLLCELCGLYKFWICCNLCSKWYRCDCDRDNLTRYDAEPIDYYECPPCQEKDYF